MRFGATSRGWSSTRATTAAAHELAVGFQPGEAKRLTRRRRAGRAAHRRRRRGRWSRSSCPTASSSCTGAPALRRAHLDQVVAALWPARAARAAAYAAALGAAQRAARRDPRRPRRPRLAAGVGRRARAPRDRADATTAPRRSTGSRRGSPSHAAELGLEGEPALAYRPRSKAATPTSSRPSSPSASDVRPRARLHRPRPAPRRPRASARAAASCAPTARRASSGSGCSRCCWPSARCWPPSAAPPPLMLLDDVMSELDAGPPRAPRRGAARAAGRAVITTTDLAHVPGAEDADVARVAIAGGDVLQDAPAASEPRGDEAPRPAAGRRRARRADGGDRARRRCSPRSSGCGRGAVGEALRARGRAGRRARRRGHRRVRARRSGRRSSTCSPSASSRRLNEALGRARGAAACAARRAGPVLTAATLRCCICSTFVTLIRARFRGVCAAILMHLLKAAPRPRADSARSPGRRRV